MNDCVCAVDEKAVLRNENEYLKARIKEAEDKTNECQEKLEKEQEKIKALECKIQFLEGQIDAYQYCIKCKR